MNETGEEKQFFENHLNRRPTAQARRVGIGVPTAENTHEAVYRTGAWISLGLETGLPARRILRRLVGGLLERRIHRRVSKRRRR
jgi:hypothetical protein